MNEWKTIIDFAEGTDFGSSRHDAEIAHWQMQKRQQLRCLWTAYCLLYGIVPDGTSYNKAIEELWKHVVIYREILGSSDEFDDLTCFELWMREYLV